MNKVCLLGSGNVAWHFGQWMIAKNIDLVHVYSRTKSAARSLAEELDCPYTDCIQEITKEADIYLLCINDDSIAEFMNKWSLKFTEKQILIHTSGSIPSSVFKSFHDHFGCVWPIQSLTKDITSNATEIPFVITASDEATKESIFAFIHTISDHIIETDDETKSDMHFMAVMVNNFTNHIYSLVEDFGKEKQIDFNIFLPLIKASIDKLSFASPSEIQTGPARRNDQKIIQNHLTKLNKYPELQEVYTTLSQSIITKYHQK
jgi:predicted short-subunit dehydrogenase-like oxidoreductase (DUF2520 family)